MNFMEDDPGRRKTLSGPQTDLRVSTREREAAVETLQTAYTQGQLEENELDERIRLALKAKFQSDLSPLFADLPVPVEPPRPAPPSASGRKSSMNLMAWGTAVQRNGAWTVPGTVKGLLYKGRIVLDLRQATFTASETVVKVASYKGHLEVIVPPGYRVETEGFSYKGSWDDKTKGGGADGPVIRLRSAAYKGSVTIREDES